MESAKSRAACRTFPERQRAKGWSPEASEGRHHLERMQSAPEPGPEALHPLLADIMGGLGRSAPRRPAGGILRRLPGEGRRPSPETERAPRGQGRPADRTGAGAEAGARQSDAAAPNAQGTTSGAHRRRARASGSGDPHPGRAAGRGCPAPWAIRYRHPDATTLAVSYPAQDFLPQDFVGRDASHAAGRLESLVLLGPYSARYRPHMPGVPPGLPLPAGSGLRRPGTLEHADPSI